MKARLHEKQDDNRSKAWRGRYGKSELHNTRYVGGYPDRLLLESNVLTHHVLTLHSKKGFNDKYVG